MLNHHFIKTTFKFYIKPMNNREKPQRKRRFDTTQLKDQTCQDSLQSDISTALEEVTDVTDSPKKMWNTLRQSVFDAAAEC